MLCVCQCCPCVCLYEILRTRAHTTVLFSRLLTVCVFCCCCDSHLVVKGVTVMCCVPCSRDLREPHVLSITDIFPSVLFSSDTLPNPRHVRVWQVRTCVYVCVFVDSLFLGLVLIIPSCLLHDTWKTRVTYVFGRPASRPQARVTFRAA